MHAYRDQIRHDGYRLPLSCHPFKIMIRLTVLALASLSAIHSHAEDIQVAVAANFGAPVKSLAIQFEKETGHRVAVTLGSTGRFYAQIKNGAPFDALLAADQETPDKLERQGLAVAGSRFTYAVGRLVLWSPRPGFVDDRGEVLSKGGFTHLAIANPRLAPYGRAAMETLQALGLLERFQPKLVMGENIAQAYQFAATGSAELGLVALSQVMEDGAIRSGSAWPVPARFHTPIRQDAVMLNKGRSKPAVQEWLRFLKSAPARETIRRFGYEF
jgi:molybdate transport system substrate-binding protein